MTGIPLLIVFCLAIILMIVAISKFHIHPFLSLMGTSLVLAVVVGLPLEKIPGIIGSGFSGVFSSIGIVIILGALIGLILEKTGGCHPPCGCGDPFRRGEASAVGADADGLDRFHSGLL